ncbi:HlyD family secretion protein [gamma proteobacterium HdN1]|nr:HlyD family secretion protein [gamma proteobacterium HdN1]
MPLVLLRPPFFRRSKSIVTFNGAASFHGIASFALIAALMGCQPPQTTEAQPRAVRTMVAGVSGIDADYRLAGEIKARVESRLAFQVGGRIIERKVNLGSQVRAGDLIARIDMRDLELALSAAQARVESARADYRLTETERKRFAELLRQEVIPQSTFDAREAALEAARSRLNEASAQLDMQRNQKQYADLRADADGVIIGIDADVGEVVAVGQPIVRLAQQGKLEVEVEFPEDKRLLAQSSIATASSWAHPEQSYPARLRELSAAADPVTRTYSARYQIEDPSAKLQLGQTAFLTLRPPEQKAVMLPTTALLEKQGKTQVWIFEPVSGSVHRQGVEILGVSGNLVLVSGLTPKQEVVTAGVHVLVDNQKVARLGPPPPEPSSSNFSLEPPPRQPLPPNTSPRPQ